MGFGKPVKIKKSSFGEPVAVQGPLAPPPDPALATIMGGPGEPVPIEEPQREGGYSTAFIGSAKLGGRAGIQQSLGHEAAYGGFTMPRGDRPVPASRRLEAIEERPVVRAKAAEEAMINAAKMRELEVEQDFAGRNITHDVVAAGGSMLGMLAASVPTGLMFGPQAATAQAAFGESAQEQGFVEATLINDYGMSPEDAHKKSMWVFAVNLPLNYLLDKGLMKYLPDEGFVKRLKAAGGAKGIAKIIAKDAGLQFLREGGQEGTQENISSLAVTGELAPIEQTGKAVLVGGIVGQAASVGGSLPQATRVLSGIDENVEAIPTPDKTVVQEGEETIPLKSDLEPIEAFTDPAELQKYAEDARGAAESARIDGDEATAAEMDRAAQEFEDEAFAQKDFNDMTIEEKRSAPIKGVPITRLFSRLLRQEITIEELIEEIPNYLKGQAGAVTDAMKSTVRAQIILERKAAREANKSIENEADKQALPSLDDKAVHSRALLETLSPEIRAQLTEEGGLGDVRSNALKDTRRTIFDISNKVRNTAIERNSQRLGEMMQLVRGRLEDMMVKEVDPILLGSGLKRGSKVSEVMAKVQDIFPYGSNTQEFFAGPGKALLQKVPQSQRERFMVGAEMLRDFDEKVWRLRTVMGESFGTKMSEGRGAKGYIPKIEKIVSIFKNPRKSVEQRLRPQRYSNTEDTGSARVRSPRERQRSDTELDNREWDVFKLMEEYIGDTARRVAYQPVTGSSKAISAGMKQEIHEAEVRAKERRKEAKQWEEELEGDESGEVANMIAELKEQAQQYDNRAKGLERSEEAFNNVIQASYNNVSFGWLNKLMRNWQSTTDDTGRGGDLWARTGVLTNKGAAGMKQMFNRAKYKLNVPFMVLRQWTSSGQAWGFEGVSWWDTVVAARDAFLYSTAVDAAQFVTRKGYSSKARDLNLGTTTGTIKAGQQGRMSREGQSGMRRAQLGGRGVIGTLDDLTDAPTAYVEEITGRFAASVANRVADRMTYIENGKEIVGLTGRMRNDYISDVVAQMQSEYHNEARAEMLRNPVLNALLPAQSFALEMGQNVSRAGIADKARIMMGMMTANVLYQVMNNYKDFTDKDEVLMFAHDMMWDTIETAIPFSSAITGRGPSGGRTYTATLLEDIGSAQSYIEKAIDSDTEKERNIYYGRAASDIVKNFAPVGGQINRALTAQVMLARGKITQDELAQASIFGWWTTEGGQNYLRRLAGLERKDDGETLGRQAPTRGGRSTRTAPKRN